MSNDCSCPDSDENSLRMKEGTLLSELNPMLCPDCDPPVKTSRDLFTVDRRVEPVPSMQINTSVITPVVDPNRRSSGNSALATVEMVFPDGSYRGVYNQDGVPNGRGTMRFNDGSIYEGDWNNGVMEGQGVSFLPIIAQTIQTSLTFLA